MEHLRFVNEMDEGTLKEIMLTYGQDVWNYAYFLTGKHDLADDISQDVFLSDIDGVDEHGQNRAFC